MKCWSSSTIFLNGILWRNFTQISEIEPGRYTSAYTKLAFWMIQKWLPGGGSLFGCSEVDPQVANLAVEACLEAQRSSKI